MWADQLEWLDKRLRESTADWQIIVSHFPPQWSWGSKEWRDLSDKYGIDLFVGAHRHQQELHEWGEAHMPWVVTGGGGGVTSEADPHSWGNGLDQYGFMDMTISKESATIEAINQFGAVRGSMTIKPREGLWQLEQRENQSNGELQFRVQSVAARRQDFFDVKSEPEISCDGMGELLSNNSCGATFDGAQVRGMLRLGVSSAADFIASVDVKPAVQAALAELAGPNTHTMDVSAEMSPFHPAEHFSRDAVDVNFSIEVPKESLVLEVGRTLNSKSIMSINTVLSHAGSLPTFGASAVSLEVDGVAPLNRTLELEAVEDAGSDTPYWAYLLICNLCACALVMATVAYCLRRTQQTSKRGSFSYSNSRSESEDGASEPELE
jgi:hypothetical protein